MIYDIQHNPFFSHEIDVEPAGVIEFQIEADCFAGKFLRATEADDLTIEGRFAGDVLFVDLVADGLDTSDFDGEVKIFDIRITASDVGYQIENVEFQVKT